MTVARASGIIGASRQAVGDVLLMPDTPTKIMPVDEVVSPWRLGEPFVWTFEMAGKPCRLEGLVEAVDAR